MWYLSLDVRSSSKCHISVVKTSLLWCLPNAISRTYQAGAIMIHFFFILKRMQIWYNSYRSSFAGGFVHICPNLVHLLWMVWSLEKLPQLRTKYPKDYTTRVASVSDLGHESLNSVKAWKKSRDKLGWTSNLKPWPIHKPNLPLPCLLCCLQAIQLVQANTRL